jgi:3-oxoadipate enol-lactonase
MAYLEIDDGNALFYEHHAPSDRHETFVFCNSMGLSTRFWRDNITPNLRNQGFGTLAFDYRGQGESRYDASATLEPTEIIGDIGRLLSEVNPARPILVGISIGGQYAAQAILSGAPAVGLVMSGSLRKAGPHTEWIIELENRLIELGGLRLAEEALSPVISSDTALTALRATHLQNEPYIPTPGDNPRLRIGRGLAKYRWDVEYEKLPVPTLVLTGSHDRLFRVREHVDELMSRIPDGRLINFEDNGHVLHREIPDEFVATLIRFADEIGQEK